VLEGMLKGLGARITRVSRPFAPESGAYGTGRTMGHDHGHSHAPGTPFHTHDHHSHDGHIHHHGAHFHGGDEAD